MSNVLTVVVTYNRKDLLTECLDALSKCGCDVLVIDNHSTDGTSEVVNNISTNENKIYYYDTGKNLGGAGGYNIGLRKACEYDYKYFWLMDDDCIVHEKSLSEFLDADKALCGKWGFLSSKVLWIDGNICKTNVQRKAVARFINDFDSSLVSVDYASFVSLFIKKEDVIKVGLPIKDFFIWSDDLEYTRRLTMKVGLGYLVNESVVTHKCKENIGVDITKDSKDRIDRYKYIYRNDVYTFRREGIRGWIFLIARYIYHLLKILFIGSDKLKKISIMTNGYIDGLTFHPEIEYLH